MLRTQIYLPSEQIKLLKELAYKQDISLSEVIRDLIQEKVVGEDNKKSHVSNTGAYLLSLAQKAKRMKIKASKDLASNLDDYLYGNKK